MRRFVNIKDMPNFNPVVKNGIDSVSKGLVEVKELFPRAWSERFETYSTAHYDYEAYPYCKVHGAMNKVSGDGIWRCLACGVGCFEVSDHE